MTASSASNLSTAKIQRLLQAVGSAPTTVEPDGEVVLYDWRDPHYFSEDQRNRLAALMTQVAALLSDRFAHFYKSEFNVRPKSIAQHFVADLVRQIDPNQGFSLSFGPDPEAPCGLLLVASETALGWATRLLGDSEGNDDPDRPISSLEESLLADLLTAVAETVLSPLRDQQELHIGADLSKGCPTMSYESTDAICRIIFEVQQTGTDEKAEISFVMPCSLLAPAVGKLLLAETQPSQEQMAQLLMEHVQQMPVTVTARLASTRLCFEEILDLGPNDILLIDKPVAEPMDLIVDGRAVFRGRPARSSGQFAVYVTECIAEVKDGTATNPAAAQTKRKE